VGLRVIGGQFRGSKLRYVGDQRVRPMKERVREALFNLTGPKIQGTHALDLFAGSGALAIEAISRGAAGATLVEIHLPTARVARENLASLDLQSRCEVVHGNVFRWVEREPRLPEGPWCVFCSPPYEFYENRHQEMLDLIRFFFVRSPPGSMIVVESDKRFHFDELDDPEGWVVRSYPPAVVGIYRKPHREPSPPE
jgi:16S rRNA (guanine966-N2)-methyltransferase